MVEKVVKILEQSGFPNTLDIRVTYTHSGVKVNISYIGSSDKQKKPSPGLRIALMNALTSYQNNLILRLQHNRKEMNKPIPADRIPEYHDWLRDEAEMYEKMLPYIGEAIEYVSGTF